MQGRNVGTRVGVVAVWGTSCDWQGAVFARKREKIQRGGAAGWGYSARAACMVTNF